MTLTVEALGLYDVPVISSDSLEALDTSLMHVPETSFPWDGGAQRNVYISGHYLGYPGTASRLVFYNLDKLKSGDEAIQGPRGQGLQVPGQRELHSFAGRLLGDGPGGRPGHAHASDVYSSQL